MFLGRAIWVDWQWKSLRQKEKIGGAGHSRERSQKKKTCGFRIGRHQSGVVVLPTRCHMLYTILFSSFLFRVLFIQENGKSSEFKKNKM